MQLVTSCSNTPLTPCEHINAFLGAAHGRTTFVVASLGFCSLQIATIKQGETKDNFQ